MDTAETSLSPQAAQFFEARKLPFEQIRKYGVIATDKGLGYEAREKASDEPRYIKWRGWDKKYYIKPSGVTLLPWPLPILEPSDGKDRPLIITEGEPDALSWLCAGAQYAVTVPNGAPSRPGEGDIVPSQDSHFKWLWQGDQIRPEIDKFESIYLSTDGDTPGRILADELAVRLGRHRCWVIDYPRDIIPELNRSCKDANEVWQHFGKEGLIKIFKEARPLISNRLTSVGGLPSLSKVSPYLSAWSKVDEHLRIVPPELVVVTGVPGAGKSTWVRVWMMNVARLYGEKIAFLQFEDNVIRTIEEMRRYAETWGKGPEVKRYSGPSDREVYLGLVNRVGPDGFIEEFFRLVQPEFRDTDDLNLAWLSNTIREAVQRHGCKFVVIDPWNELEHIWARHELQSTYLNRALKELKHLARTYQICIVVVSHPDKASGINQNFEEMTAYSIDGGAAWNNKSDHVVIVGRDKDDATKTLIKVDKCKDWLTMGRPGTTELRFEVTRGVYVTL